MRLHATLRVCGKLKFELKTLRNFKNRVINSPFFKLFNKLSIYFQYEKRTPKIN